MGHSSLHLNFSLSGVGTVNPNPDTVVRAKRDNAKRAVVMGDSLRQVTLAIMMCKWDVPTGETDPSSLPTCSHHTAQAHAPYCPTRTDPQHLKETQPQFFTWKVSSPHHTPTPHY